MLTCSCNSRTEIESLYLLIEECSKKFIRMSCLHDLMLLLPVDVQTKIHECLVHILRREKHACNVEYLMNRQQRELCYEHSDNCLYMLLESHDIEEYGFTSANVSSLGVAGTLRVVFSNVHVDKSKIEDIITKGLMKRIAKVHKHTVLDNHEIDILNLRILSLQTKSIAYDRLIYGLIKIIKQNSLIFVCKGE